MSDPKKLLEEKTHRYLSKMPYLKALILVELQNEIEIYSYLNEDDIQFSSEANDDFMRGLRGGISDLYTDFKKQFQKINQGSENAANYQVSVMYDKYFVRKREIVDGILMVAICDTERDGLTPEM